MKNVKAWISAARLRTLPLSVSGILLGSSLAYQNGFWDVKIFVFALITTVLFQILSNFANDLGDSQKGTDNKDRIGPERTVQSGAISTSQMKLAVVSMSIISLISAGYLIYLSSYNMPTNMLWTYGGLALACTGAAILYTVGKKAYGYYGLGDLMVFIFFGGVSVLGVYSLYAKHFNWNIINAAIYVGLMSTAVLNLNNMRDYLNDKRSGKNTLVVKMGPDMAKFYHMALIVIGLISLFQIITKIGDTLFFLGGIPALYMLYHLYKVMKTKHAKDFDPELKMVALSTFLTCLVLLVLIVVQK